MKRWKRLGQMLFFIAVISAAWYMEDSTACAGGANISIQTDNHTIRSGEIFYVIITVTSSEEMRGFEGYFSYNQSVMKYMTGGSVSSGNDDVFSISDTNREKPSTRLKYSIQFKARKSGKSTIALKSPYHIYQSDEDADVSVAFNTLNLLVVKKSDKIPQEDDKAEENSPEPDNRSEDTSSEENSSGWDAEAKVALRNSASPVPKGEEGTEELPKTSSVEVANGFEGAEEYVEASPETFAQKRLTEEEKEVQRQQIAERKKSSQRLFYILVIMTAVTGLVCLGVAAYAMWYRREDERNISESRQDIWQEEGQTVQSKGNQMEEPDEIPAEQSLEEIERRLERKRLWLDKKR